MPLPPADRLKPVGLQPGRRRGRFERKCDPKNTKNRPCKPLETNGVTDEAEACVTLASRVRGADTRVCRAGSKADAFAPTAQRISRPQHWPGQKAPKRVSARQTRVSAPRGFQFNG